MAQQVTVTAKGLFTSPNQLGDVPDGALRQADNVVISKDGVIEPRRGAASSEIGSAVAGDFTRLAAHSSILFARNSGGGSHYSSNVAVSSWASDSGIGQWTDLVSWGTRAIQLRSNADPVVWEALNTFTDAWLPPGLDMSYALSGGAGTALANNTSAAYRLVWCRTNPDGTETIGSPSERLVVTNTAGGPRDVVVTYSNPDAAGAGTVIFRVYRSASVAAGATPSDEMGLVYQGAYTGTGPRTGTFTDVLPEALLGASLYTSPSQEGSGNANAHYLKAKRGAEFRGSLFLGNVNEASRVETTLLASGAGAPSGIQIADTVTLTRNVFYVTTLTGAAAENIGALQFQVFNTGSPASDVENTARSIVRVFNRGSANYSAEWMEYVSGDNDQPGRISYRFYNAGDLSFACSRSTAFLSQPSVAATSATLIHPGRIYWSKSGTPDQISWLSFADVGEPGAEVLRLVSTRDALFIFKVDGIWRLTGSGGVWDIQPLDPTTALVAPESAAAFENAVFALCDSGVMRITESGVENIGGPIYEDIETLLLPAARATTASVAFGIAYHSDHKYILWLPTAAGDAVAKQAYVFDSWTDSWERWVPPAGVTGFYHGIVNPADDRLYMVDGTNVWQERKAGASADHTDGASSAIPSTVKWAPRFGGNPGAMHRFREVSLHFRSVQFTTATLTFSTDVSPSEETVTLTGSDYGCSAAERGQTVIRALVPLEKSRGSQLNVTFSSSNAGMGFEIEGMSVVFNPGSTRVGR